MGLARKVFDENGARSVGVEPRGATPSAGSFSARVESCSRGRDDGVDQFPSKRRP